MRFETQQCSIVRGCIYMLLVTMKPVDSNQHGELHTHNLDHTGKQNAERHINKKKTDVLGIRVITSDE